MTEIRKLENGTRNPSIKQLQRLAEGMDMVLNSCLGKTIRVANMLPAVILAVIAAYIPWTF